MAQSARKPRSGVSRLPAFLLIPARSSGCDELSASSLLSVKNLALARRPCAATEVKVAYLALLREERAGAELLNVLGEAGVHHVVMAAVLVAGQRAHHERVERRAIFDQLA